MEYDTYEYDGKTRQVDLAQDCILVLPWRRDSLWSKIRLLAKDEFEFSRTNHRGLYFTHMRLCVVVNGRHSVTAGIHHKKGVIEVPVVNVSKLFKHVHTDGAYWYNSHTGEKLRDLMDFRIGILYEVAKLKYRIEAGEGISSVKTV